MASDEACSGPGTDVPASAAGAYATPTTSAAAKAMSFATDRTFCTHLPGRMPSALIAVSTTTVSMAIPLCARTEAPVRAAVSRAKPAASVAMEPGKPIQKLVHPDRKPMLGP